jgi:sodium-independent sulfate anion transporter 11
MQTLTLSGITIGAVVVPQSMAYAKLAELRPEFGLYSSFMGVLLYWFFATSKDITIGPVAVMSTLVGNVVIKAKETHPDLNAEDIAIALSVIVGGITLGLGLLRLGFIVDLISLPAISAFMTGSAITIAVGQVSALMGITLTSGTTRDEPYKVIIHTLGGLPSTSLDAALGLTALALLYIIRGTFNYLARKQPHRRKLWFFCNTLRTAFVILLYTLISWACQRDLPDRSDNTAKHLTKWKILGPVPRGFTHAAVPKMSSEIINLFVSEIPVSVIVLLIEHISIAKSFGRVNNYTINPSQELVAIGVTNLLAPFLGGYPATGSFSRTAIKSKAGVRTPFAGVYTAVVVLLAIYALTVVFFYIPNAALSAVIIHAVGDLITPPNTVYQFWKISPLEALIFLIGVFVTVFSSIENGIYTTVVISFAVFLFRVFKAQGRFLGRVQIHSVVGDHVLDETHTRTPRKPDNDPNRSTRNIYLPISHADGSNPSLDVGHPHPGVFIYRFSEGYNYPNANHYLDAMVEVIFKETQRTDPNTYGRLGDRPWNDPGPRRGKEAVSEAHKPTLKAVILDFSSVNNVDVTSVQHLIDVRNQLDRHAAPDTVQWHFTSINNRWTKRALVNAGFGYPTPHNDGGFHRWKPIFSVADMGGINSAAAAAERDLNHRQLKRELTKDAEEGRSRSVYERDIQPVDETLPTGSDNFENAINKSSAYSTAPTNNIAVVAGLNRPFFHIDLTSAVESAIKNIEVLAPLRGQDDSSSDEQPQGKTTGAEK